MACPYFTYPWRKPGKSPAPLTLPQKQHITPLSVIFFFSLLSCQLSCQHPEGERIQKRIERTERRNEENVPKPAAQFVERENSAPPKLNTQTQENQLSGFDEEFGKVLEDGKLHAVKNLQVKEPLTEGARHKKSKSKSKLTKINPRTSTTHKKNTSSANSSQNYRVSIFSLKARSKPHLHAPITAHFKENELVQVYATHGSWFRVGKSRWVHSKYLEAVQ